MRFLKMLSVALPILIVASSLSAVAGTVQLQFNGNGPYSYGAATYPYYFTVNGTQSAWLMCIGYNEHVTYGEKWEAKEMTVDAYGKSINNPLLAEQLAYLFTLARADQGANPKVNAEAWFLKEGQPSSAAPLTLLSGFHRGTYSDVHVYVPTENHQGWTEGEPQTFLGTSPVPEPSSLLMMGTGILGLAGVIRRKLS
jgi:hypothetical protein